MNRLKRIFLKTGLIVLAVALFASCIKEGEQSYSAQEFGFITTESGTIYARMASGYLITSPQISLEKYIGRCAFIKFSVNSQTEKMTIGENIIIWKATVASEPSLIDQASMIFSPAPTESPVRLSEIVLPGSNSNFEYFGNNWPFKYTCKIKKGEQPMLKFYVPTPDEMNDSDDDTIVIDIKLEITGTPESDATEKKEEFITVCDFTRLRQMIPAFVQGSTSKSINMRFRYYLEGQSNYINSNNYQIEALIN